jgi:signal recognition particle subunit SRP54
MPSPEEMAKLAEKTPGGPPPNMPPLPGAAIPGGKSSTGTPPPFPGLPGNLPGLGGPRGPGLPGLGGVPGFRKKK